MIPWPYRDAARAAELRSPDRHGHCSIAAPSPHHRRPISRYLVATSFIIIHPISDAVSQELYFGADHVIIVQRVSDPCPL